MLQPMQSACNQRGRRLPQPELPISQPQLPISQPELPISAARFYNVNARGISRVLATEPLVLAGANHGSPSDDEVSGYKADPRRASASERSNQLGSS